MNYSQKKYRSLISELAQNLLEIVVIFAYTNFDCKMFHKK